MSPASGRATRAARSGAAVGAAVLVALAAHLAGGGSAPAPLLLAAVVALAWPAALLLVGGRPSLLRQAAVVAVAQGLLHGVFALGQPAPTVGDPMAGMHGVPLTLAAPMPAMHHGGAMWWAHAGAWAVTVLAWRYGEAALRLVLERVPVPRLPAAPRPLPVAPGRSRPPRVVPLPVPVPLRAHRDRGPPLPA